MGGLKKETFKEEERVITSPAANKKQEDSKQSECGENHPMFQSTFVSAL